MMKRQATALLCVLVLVPSARAQDHSPFGRRDGSGKGPARVRGAKGKPGGEIPALIRQYVHGDEAERNAAIAKLREHDAIDESQIRTFTRAVWNEVNRRPKANGKVLNHPKYPMKYALTGRPQPGGPLLIYLHGGGASKSVNDSGWSTAKGMAGGMGFPCALVPRNYDDSSIVGWWEDSGIIALEALIREMRRTYGIDTNQVYIGGYSMGGWGTSVVGPALADRFAAIYSMAGGTGMFTQFENLRNTPFAIHIGDKDTANGRLSSTRKMRDILEKLHREDPDGYEIWYKEYPGVGHGLPGSAHREIGAWLKKHRRDPIPKVVVWRPFESYIRMFYWLWMDNPPRGLTIRAEIKKGNRIEVTGAASGLTILLNPKMLNLKKEVTVVVGGSEVFKGLVRPSLTAIVQSIAEKEDPNLVFTHRIDLN